MRPKRFKVGDRARVVHHPRALEFIGCVVEIVRVVDAERDGIAFDYEVGGELVIDAAARRLEKRFPAAPPEVIHNLLADRAFRVADPWLMPLDGAGEAEPVETDEPFLEGCR